MFHVTIATYLKANTSSAEKCLRRSEMVQAVGIDGCLRRNKIPLLIEPSLAPYDVSLMNAWSLSHAMRTTLTFFPTTTKYVAESLNLNIQNGI